MTSEKDKCQICSREDNLRECPKCHRYTCENCFSISKNQGYTTKDCLYCGYEFKPLIEFTPPYRRPQRVPKEISSFQVIKPFGIVSLAILILIVSTLLIVPFLQELSGRNQDDKWHLVTAYSFDARSAMFDAGGELLGVRIIGWFQGGNYEGIASEWKNIKLPATLYHTLNSSLANRGKWVIQKLSTPWKEGGTPWHADLPWFVFDPIVEVQIRIYEYSSSRMVNLELYLNSSNFDYRG